jgi:phosphoribosylamine--glycine ligase
MGKRIGVVDSGGRGDALARLLAKSPQTDEILVIPGNGGTERMFRNVPLNVTDVDGIMALVEKEKLDLVVAPQEDSLVAGIADRLAERGHRVFGPSKKAIFATEASKTLCKETARRAGIPMAPWQSYDRYSDAVAYVSYRNRQYFIKADELALGKGSWKCPTVDEGVRVLHKIMVDQVHGPNVGKRVVIEDAITEHVYGEISLHAFCDGKTASTFPFSMQDHKPVFDGDEGLNTGGMGVTSHVPWYTEKMLREDDHVFVQQMLRQLLKEGVPFVGMLYPQLIVTKDGPKNIEYNGRPGDPETEVWARLFKGDIVEVMEACIDGHLAECEEVQWEEGLVAGCVVIASGGYPGDYQKGKVITGIEKAEESSNVTVFHAGTKWVDGKLVTNGGRVLVVSAVADSLQKALQDAYEAASYIHFDGMHMRRDIGRKAMTLALSGEVAV